MLKTDLNGTDGKLLGLLQMEFPLMAEPYAELGQRLGISGTEVMQRIHDLREKGIVRQISPVLDARKLGYHSTLVAMKVSSERLARAQQFIIDHQGVSHGYQREHEFNVWITLTIPHKVDIKTEIARIGSACGAEAIFDLPALKIFKLRAYFGADGDEAPESNNGSGMSLISQETELSRADKLAINGLQQDLPLTPAPFESLAGQLDMDVSDFLERCRSLLEQGVIRRYGAAINHRGVGYKGNAMTCWAVPAAMVDGAGKKLAALPEVSHCYERKTNSLWRYNLFAMVHGSSAEACWETVRKVSAEIGLNDYAMLFSTREFKKTRIKLVL